VTDFIFGRFEDGTVGVKVQLHVVFEPKCDSLPAEEVVFPYNSSQDSPAQDSGLEQPIYWQWLQHNKPSEELNLSKVGQIPSQDGSRTPKSYPEMRTQTLRSRIEENSQQIAPNSNSNSRSAPDQNQRRKLSTFSTKKENISASTIKENLNHRNASQWKGSIKRALPSGYPDEVKATNICETLAPTIPNLKYTGRTSCTLRNEQAGRHAGLYQADETGSGLKERSFQHQHQQIQKKINHSTDQNPVYYYSEIDDNKSEQRSSTPTRRNPNPNYRTGPRR